MRWPWWLLGVVALVAVDLACDGDESAPPMPATGVGGGGGAAGASPTGTGTGVDGAKLGAACVSADDCGGLPCRLPDPGSDPSGFAGGLCTIPCDDPDACEAIRPGARCIEGYCLEPCDYGPPDLAALDPSKCHGRTDVACYELLESSAVRDLCLPNCNGDADCGAGMFCEPGEGFCRPVESEGSPDGWPCNSDAECLGACFENTPTARGICARRCTLGHLPSCGWDGSGNASYACLLAQYPEEAGIGDGGFCGELCDCDDECANPLFVCAPLGVLSYADLPWAAPIVTGSGRTGLCVDPDAAAGGAPGIPCGQGGAGGSSGGGGSGGAGGSPGGGAGTAGSGGQ